MKNDSINNQELYYRKTKTIIENEIISSCLLLKDFRLLCVSSNYLKVYDLNNDYNCDIVIEKLPHEINNFDKTIQLSTGKLVTICSGRKMLIWKIFKNSYDLELILKKAHPGIMVNLIEITSNRIVSSYTESSIRIWKIPHFIRITTIRTKTFISNMMQPKGIDKLICMSINQFVSIINLSTYQIELKIKDQITSFIVINYQIIIATKEYLCFYELNTTEFTKSREPFPFNIKKILSFSKISNHKILFGSKDGYLGIYDLKTDKFNHLVHISRYPINFIQSINDKRYIINIEQGVAFYEY